MAKLANNDRVEPPPRDSDMNLWEVGHSDSGHICQSPQYSPSPVYVSHSGASSTGNRCSVTRQGRSVCMFPPFNPAVGWQVVPSACMEPLMQHFQAAGFQKRSLDSQQLLEVPPQTECMTTGCFAHWAAGQGFDPLGPTAAQTATFLYFLFHIHGLSPQTIKGYRSCSASVLS